MKTYIKPEIDVTDFRMPSVICLSISDEETTEALGNKRDNNNGNNADDKDPWKNGLW